jgi:hypothetical protein
MTTLQQALHIFRKDAREFRLEAAAVLFLTAMLVVTGVASWESIQEWGRAPDGDTGPLTLLLPLAWCLLIARVIHSEALPGDRQFWLTRPYSRAGLLLSKGLFIVMFINLPLLLAQAAILALDGFPLSSYLGGLLWNQLLIAALVLLPAATAASLTRNLAQFLPAAMLAAVLIFPAFEEGRLEPAWFGALLAMGVAGAIGGTILVLQYRRRRAVRHALMTLAAALVVIVVFLAFPRSAAFAIQSTLIGGPDDAFALQLGRPVAPQQPPPVTTPNRYRQLLELPIVVSGARAANLELENPRVSIRTLSGVIVRTSSQVTQLGPDGFLHAISVGRDFYEAAKTSPVTIRAEYVITVFGNERPAEIPLDGTPLLVDGLGQCGTTPNYNRRTILCRLPFRGWKSVFSDRVESNGYSAASRPQVMIHPVSDRRFELTGESGNEIAPATPERPVTLVAREPVAYFRYNMEARNVRLAEYAIPEPAGRER